MMQADDAMVDTAAPEALTHGSGAARGRMNPRAVTLAVVVIVIIAVAIMALQRSGPTNAYVSSLKSAMQPNRVMSLADFISTLNSTINAANQSGSSNVTYQGFVNMSANSAPFSFSYAIPFNVTELTNGSYTRTDIKMSTALGAIPSNNETLYIDAVRDGTSHYICTSTGPASGFRCQNADMSNLSALYGQALGVPARLGLATLLSGVTVKVTGVSSGSYSGKPCTLFTADASGSLSGLWSLLLGNQAAGGAVNGPTPELNGTLSACFDDDPGPLIPLNASVVLAMASRVNGSVAEFVISLQAQEVSMGTAPGISAITALPGPLIG